MSRRASQDEPGFGSDSFLDIIANLVGILIILIVLAGLRASETVHLAETDETETAGEPVVPPPAPAVDEDAQFVAYQAHLRTLAKRETENEKRRAMAFTAAQEKEEHDAEKQRRLLAIQKADQLKAEEEEAARQIARLTTLSEKTTEEGIVAALADAEKTREEQNATVRVLSATRDRLNKEKEEADSRLTAQANELNELAKQLDEVNRQFVQLADIETEKKTLTHRVSPVGRVVTEEEIHFRISRGKVSHVPIRELTEILKDKIRQNGSWLVRVNRHSGVVGPVDGYRLEYVIERQQPSMSDELRMGRGMVRVGLSEFQVQPTSDLYEETIVRSIERDGLVFRQLLSLPPETPITLWVYPDSFAEYRVLANFAQQNGFIVAGRPLPKGLPIAGSPHGSKSVAQ